MVVEFEVGLFETMLICESVWFAANKLSALSIIPCMFSALKTSFARPDFRYIGTLSWNIPQTVVAQQQLARLF